MEESSRLLSCVMGDSAHSKQPTFIESLMPSGSCVLIPRPLCEEKALVDDIEIPGSPGSTCKFTVYSST